MSLSAIAAWVAAVVAALFAFFALTSSDEGLMLALQWSPAVIFTATSIIFAVVAWKGR